MAIQFNLLPWREQQRTRKEKTTKQIMLFAVIIGLLVSGGYYGLEKIKLDDHEKALSLITSKNRALEPKLAEKRKLDALKENLNRQIDSIEALQSDRASISHMVEELSNANTQELFLTEFTLKDGNVSITGIAGDDTQIANLMKKLIRSEWYQEPKLLEIIASPKLGEEVKTFKITSKLLLPGSDMEKGGKKNG